MRVGGGASTNVLNNSKHRASRERLQENKQIKRVRTAEMSASFTRSSVDGAAGGGEDTAPTSSSSSSMRRGREGKSFSSSSSSARPNADREAIQRTLAQNLKYQSFLKTQINKLDALLVKNAEKQV